MSIAITRISICSSLGTSLEETVDGLRHGRVGIHTPADLEQRPAFDSGAGEAPLPADFRGAWRAELMLRRSVQEALTESDRSEIATAGERWGVVIGTTLAGMRHCGLGMRADEAGDPEQADAHFARTCAASVLAHAMRGVGVSGPAITVSCACASALTAVAHACSMLEARTVDAVIAGGYDPIAEFAYGGFSALQLVARGALSPFAHEREGMKLGEGAAIFVLRRLDDCRSPGLRASVRAVIVGTGESSDAHHLTQPHPAGAGAARALIAVRAKDAKPDLVIAHATGTPGNDGAEYLAYREAFGDQLPAVPVVALKSRFGHPLGAAGVLELASVIGCAESGFVPTTAGRGRDAEAFPDLQLLEGDAKPGRPRDIVALSAGFGGANAAIRITRDGTVDAAPIERTNRPACLRIREAGAVTIAGRGAAALRELRGEGCDWSAFSEETLAPLLDRSRTRRLSLLARLMIGAVRDLVEVGGLSADDLRHTPLVAANWCGAADFTERYYRDLVRSGIDLANPMLFAESVPNIGSAQCSLAFGIEAPSMSLIGQRTAALEALHLVSARVANGQWDRAIIVAAEESHPIVERTLSRCAPGPVALRSAAIALLVERAEGSPSAWGDIEVTVGRSAPLDSAVATTQVLEALRGPGVASVTSGSPFDQCAAQSAGFSVDGGIDALPEMGAATPLALLLRSAGRRVNVVSVDPHGSCWGMRGCPC